MRRVLRAQKVPLQLSRSRVEHSQPAVQLAEVLESVDAFPMIAEDQKNGKSKELMNTNEKKSDFVAEEQGSGVLLTRRPPSYNEVGGLDVRQEDADLESGEP
ncbi:hypothetical protein NDU88_004182 [Pleurodeles waltl]|uniref:Uncharacterized protein n=1 Tax=Pleurodeles waltl TaxID=8319 RepID=A0AAV7QE24_PLEWA|nr:hypothetical protein NDU88_004182 [Pleurodeles waltl]